MRVGHDEDALSYFEWNRELEQQKSAEREGDEESPDTRESGPE